MGELRLSFLGGFAVQRLGVALKAFESDKTRLLLAYLAVESGRAHRRESLTGLFWPDVPETKAHHSLSQALYSLRKKLHASTEDPLLEINPQEVRLRVENIWLDVHEFDALIQACNDHPHNTSWICPSCLERLNRAAGLYRGDFLSGLTLPGCQAFGEWLLIQQESLRQKMVRVAGQLSQLFEMTGDLEKALTHASRQVALDPLDESAHRQVMRLLNRQGRRLDALAHYTACQQILEDELGIPPEVETTELYEQIRTLPESQMPKPPGLRNLPTLLTTLVGRQPELEQLRQKLLDPACCLVTVTGAGGAGKTCLTLEAGRSMAAIFPDGVFLVELDTQQSNLMLLPAVARAVGLELQSGRDFRPSSILEQVCSFLQDKRLLLILDGFDGLLHEADQVAVLLRSLPGLKILATSRKRLNLSVEQVFLIGGLTYPVESATEDLDTYDAVQLFIQGAQRADPEFELTEYDRLAVAEICRLVEGIPLGILMAAAWVSVFSPAQIVQEIHRSLDFLAIDWRDLPGRQRSLRATFDYSWHLLNAAARSVFQRLSVLRSSFSFERARQVAGASPEILKDLVEQSLLLNAGPGRFRMHDLLRQYAQEKLAAMPTEDHDTHLRYCQLFLQALADWEPGLKSARQPAVLAEIDQEYADILAAWQWAVANGQVELLEKAVEPFWYYHNLHGLFAEAIPLYRSAMQHLESEGLTSTNLRLWVRLGIWLTHLLSQHFEYEQARIVITRVEKSMKEWDGLTTRMQREQALLQLIKGEWLLGAGNRQQVLEPFQQGLALMLSSEEPWDVSFALMVNAIGHSRAGNIRQCSGYAEQAMDIQRSLGDPKITLIISSYMGYNYMRLGEYEAALQLAQEQVANLKRINNRFNKSSINEYLGLALFYAGQYEQARSLFEEALTLYKQSDEKSYQLFDQYVLAIIAVLTGDYDTALSLGSYPEEVAINFDFSDALIRGCVYLISSSWDLAEQALNQYLDQVRSLPSLEWVGFPLALLGYIAYRRGDPTLALDYLEQALVNGVEKGLFWIFTLALSVLALMLAEAGDPEQALELYATVTAHPCAGNSRWFEDLFGKPLAALSAGLPAQIASEAQARGRGRRLFAVGQETLDRLRASPGLRDELLLNC